MSDLRSILQTALGPDLVVDRDLGARGAWLSFTAHDSTRHRDLQINLLAPEHAVGVSGPRFVEALARITTLKEPHILPVLTAGVASNGLPYYVTPLLEGEVLGTRHVEWRLSAAQIICVLRDTAHALAYAHDQEIVHGRILPSNVQVVRGAAVLSDFGVDQALVIAGLAPLDDVNDYTAPEHISGAPDQRGDVYAWGLLAYEMLSRKRPPAGAEVALDPNATTAEVQVAPDLAALGDIPPKLATLVMRCIAKEPDHRPANGAALLEAFNSARRSSNTTIDTLSLQSASGRRWLAATLALVALILVGAVWFVQFSSHDSGETTIVVVPFESRGRAGIEYFAEGVSDEITNRLTRVPGITIIARSSAVHFTGTGKSPAEIGRQLGATYVLTGTVRWKRANTDTTVGDDNVIHIAPVLTRVDTDSIIWGGEPYEGRLANLYLAEGELAEQVVATLQGRLDGDAREAVWHRETIIPRARDEFLRGRYLLRQSGLTNLIQAGAHFKRAIQTDSEYARPWASYALVVALLPTFGDTTLTPKEANDESERAARHAIALDSLVPEAWSALSAALSRSYQWRGALGAADHAVQLESHWAPGHLRRQLPLSALGKQPESVAAAQRAVELDPLVALLHSELAAGFIEAHQLDKAGASLHHALRLDSTLVQARQGMDELVFDRWMDHGMKVDADYATLSNDPHSLRRGWLELLRNRPKTAAALDAAIEATSGHVSVDARGKGRIVSFDAPLARAELYAATGVADSAFTWLERLREHRYPLLAHALWSRTFDPIRGDPRWATFLREFRGDPLPERAGASH
ncbi:MAG: protein kinase [bacterium]